MPITNTITINGSSVDQIVDELETTNQDLEVAKTMGNTMIIQIGLAQIEVRLDHDTRRIYDFFAANMSAPA